MSLNGRIALVTGGGRGIGKAISLALAADGATIAVNYRRDEESALATVAEIEKAGGRAKTYSASVENWDEDVAMVEKVLADFGAVDILINNAGIASRGQGVADTDPAEMERVVRTHAFGPHYLSKLVLPSMRTRPRGDIIMISSVAAKSLGPNGGPYNMGKAAMEALAMTLFKEERRNNIRVNVVRPGLTETEMGSRLAKATQGVQSMRDIDARSAFGRVAQPEDVANVVRYLVSEGAFYLTGQTIEVDGGGMMALPNR
ncbi:MAG: SDR family oxidoreductase [Dehalococcoidia bacterium]|uniref:SDR family NAD(P)-dependent oxidoreductase n=1 Tax=Candidatus Amarobacter glycogenicus TaxID=3140699 RepID=UPI0031357B71|nr:SDR family oxidoreductase [Dehalococcoidia bacterium]